MHAYITRSAFPRRLRSQLRETVIIPLPTWHTHHFKTRFQIYNYNLKRKYSTTSGQLTQTTKSSPRIYSWILLSFQERYLENIIQQLPRLNHSDHTVIFLATPSFAHLFDHHHHEFFRTALETLYGSISPSTDSFEIRSITGVVDKLPGPQTIRGNVLDNAEVLRDGWEGISLLLDSTFRSSNVKYLLPEENEDDSPATIRFTSSPSQLKNSLENKKYIQHITVPLANTLFVNGRRSTLFEDYWSRNISPEKDDKSSTNLKHVKRKALKSHRIEVPSLSGPSIEVSIPLESLTGPRKVISSLGNVIREIEVNGKGRPASSELEVAVSQYMKGNTRAKPSVFALVRSNSSTPKLDHINDIGSGIVESVLAGQAKLYRVTGGGGGWGKKQGLLSLDPASNFDHKGSGSSETDINTDDGEDTHMGFATKSNQLVEEGSAVQFLASFDPQDSEIRENGTSRPIEQNQDSNLDQAIIIGTIPTSEMPPPSDTSSNEDHDRSDSIRIIHQFGVLSEAGLAIGSEEVNTNGEGETIDSKDTQVIGQSRIDVPFTLLKLPLRKVDQSSASGKG